MRKTFIGLLLALAGAIAAAQAPITVTDAWVRAAPPGVPMFAGYLTVHNTTRRPVTLVAAGSSRFERVEMHRSTMVDGVARMQAVESIEVPRRGSVALEPGGLHLMLFSPVGAVRDGDTVDLELTFADGWSLELTVPVRRP